MRPFWLIVIALYAIVPLQTAAAYQRSYPANSLSHNFGTASGAEAWSVTTADKNGVAIYGPYAADVPLSAKMCAFFYLSIADSTGDTAGVMVLDVANRGTVLNQRYLQRQHFNAANTMQAFSVCFTSPSSSTNMGVEYRVWTPGACRLLLCLR